MCATSDVVPVAIFLLSLIGYAIISLITMSILPFLFICAVWLTLVYIINPLLDILL